MKGKKKEIERRFLLTDLLLTKEEKKTLTFKTLEILQIYSEEGIRYRKTDSPKGTSYEKITKKNLGFGVNIEEDWKIKEQEFNKIQSNKLLPRIRKRRMVFSHKGLKFEIDIFKKMSLVILEVELSDINQEIQFPEFLQKRILMEVTGVKELSNFSIAKKKNV